MGSKIHLKSTYGEGSKFSFELELKKSKELAIRLAEKGREIAEKEFSVKNFADNYNLLYQNL